MSLLRVALRPLRHFADFHGRSTRTELIVFQFSSQLICVMGELAGWMVGLPGGVGGAVIGLVLMCPIVALCVRRLHDSGRAGWWLLIALPEAAIGMRRQFLLLQDPFDFARAHLPSFVELPVAFLALPVIVMLLMDDEEGPNRYGPNPRYPDDVMLADPPGEPA